MKRKLMWILVSLAFIVIIIQFFQPDTNNIPETSDHIFQNEKVPDQIKGILKNSCLDCHSNQTNYKWYHKVSPVSWFINDHIIEGKKELNLSEWNKLSPMDKISALTDIIEETENKKMPLKSYLKIHKQARLSDKQIKMLNEWAENLGMEIYKAN